MEMEKILAIKDDDIEYIINMDAINFIRFTPIKNQAGYKIAVDLDNDIIKAKITYKRYEEINHYFGNTGVLDEKWN